MRRIEGGVGLARAGGGRGGGGEELSRLVTLLAQKGEGPCYRGLGAMLTATRTCSTDAPRFPWVPSSRTVEAHLSKAVELSKATGGYCTGLWARVQHELGAGRRRGGRDDEGEVVVSFGGEGRGWGEETQELLREQTSYGCRYACRYAVMKVMVSSRSRRPPFSYPSALNRQDARRRLAGG